MHRMTIGLILLLLFALMSVSLLNATDHEDDNPVALVMSNFLGSTTYDVWLVDAVTGEQTRIRQIFGHSSIAFWSPNRRYVTLSNNKDSDSWSLSIYDTITDTITPVSYRLSDMSACGANFWSPDERFLAYQTRAGLYLHEHVDGNLSDAIQLIEGGPDHQKLQWSSDGHYLLFRDAQDDVFLLDLTQGFVQGNILLELEIPGLLLPRFSPDGRYLLTRFVDENPAGNYALIELSTRQIHYFTMDAPFGRWSPDSQYVAFRQRNEEQSSNLYFLYVNDAQIYEVPLPQDSIYNYASLWGSGVYLTAGSGGDWVSVATSYGESQIIMDEAEIGRYLSHTWSPDDTLLVIITNVDGDIDSGTHIYVYDISTIGDSTLLETLEISTLFPFGAGFYVWSEDGRYLTVKGLDDVVILDLQTGDTVTLPDDPRFGDIYPQGWVGDLLAFESYTPHDRDSMLFTYDMETRVVSLLIDNPGQLESFRGWQSMTIFQGRTSGPCGSG